MRVQFIAGDRGERVRMDYPPPFVDIASVKAIGVRIYRWGGPGRTSYGTDMFILNAIAPAPQLLI